VLFVVVLEWHRILKGGRMARRLVFLLLGLAAAFALLLGPVAGATPLQPEHPAPVPPPVMDDKPLVLGDCVAVGELRMGGKALVQFNCPATGATVFVPREAVEVKPRLRPGERDL